MKRENEAKLFKRFNSFIQRNHRNKVICALDLNVVMGGLIWYGSCVLI